MSHGWKRSPNGIPWFRLVFKRSAWVVLLVLPVSASFIQLRGITSALDDVGVIAKAFAGGHRGHGNSGNGRGNGGGKGNDSNPPGLSDFNGVGEGSGWGPVGNGRGNGGSKGNDDDPPGLSDFNGAGEGFGWGPVGNGKLQLDSDDSGEKLWVGKPDDYKIDLGKIDTRAYLEKLVIPEWNADQDLKGDHDPKGKAIGKHWKTELEDARSPSADSQSGQRAIVAIAPRTYSRREVLALNLSAVSIARAQALGFTVGASSAVQTEGGLTTLIAPPGMDAPDALALLKGDPSAGHFGLNRTYRLYHPATKDEGDNAIPASAGHASKCQADRCYARSAIEWDDSFTTCARGIRVGVIDTAVDVQHPSFARERITHKSFVPEGRHGSDNGHGTSVLALLAGRLDSGTPGLIPEASFFAANVFFIDDDGETIADTVSLLRALDWMSASGVKLVNMSFSGPQDDLVQARIENLSRQGVVFAAAAGNEGPAARPAYPAAYPQVIAVTAVTKDLRIYPFANRGEQIDLAAPGVRIWTALPNAREGYRSGTSFAVPFVTAVLAIQHPNVLQPKDKLLDQLKTLTLGSPGRNPVYGRGLLQAPAKCPNNSDSVAYSDTLSVSPAP